MAALGENGRYNRNWLNMAGLAESGQKQLDLDENGWKGWAWLEIAGIGWKGLTIAGYC